MSILFRIAVPADEMEPPVAVITARQLAALRRYLHAQSERIGVALIEPDEVLGDCFEARVCPLALASVTRLFDHDPAVIAVVEEAQFRGRRVSIRHRPQAAEITMRVALTSDCGLELDLAYGNAYALLEALGLDAESVGEITAELLRERLADPATASKAVASGVEHYLPRLERLLTSVEGVEEARFAWA